jgi:hypothetical protein
MALITNLQQVSPPHSVTVQGAFEPFDLQVARGQIMGHSPVYIFGYSTTVGSTALGPVWEGLTLSGGYYVYPSSAVQMTVASTSASDDTTKSIVINGLDANYKILTETIALNGTTNVTTVNSFFRINSVSMVNSSNVGVITLKNGGTTYAQINAGIGQTQMSIYSVPAGYTFYLQYIQADASIGFTSSNYMLFAEYNKFNANGAITLAGQSTFVQMYNQPFGIPVAHPEKTDIQYVIRANSGSPFTADIFAGGILIKNDGQTA